MPESFKLWTLLRITNVRLRFIYLMVLVGLVVGYWENINNYYDRWTRPAGTVEVAGGEQIEYYCAMHPQIVTAEPGKCPICGMPLSKRAKSDRQALPEDVLAQVRLTPLKMHIGRIATSPVGYRLLSREIRTVGIVEYDETRRAQISARIKGRIDKLFVNFTGETVTQGDPLIGIYSPDLLVAQEDLLSAMRTLKAQAELGAASKAAAQSQVAASRRKLSLWGLTDEQINQIVERGQAETQLTIQSPISGIVTEKQVLEGHYVEVGQNLYTVADMSRVWMQVKVFEDQIAGVQIGTAVEVTSTAYPTDVFAGRITFIAYTVDAATRTVSARVEVDNPELKLKPGMYASAVIRTPVGSITDLPGDATTPASAPAEQASTQHSPLNTDDAAQFYLALSDAFTNDKGDDAAAKHLDTAVKALAEHGADAVRPLAAAVAERASQLPGKDIKDQRTVLKTLSARLIELLRVSPPTNQSLFVAHCPMAQADWLQTTKPIRNPYYGAEMLDCGEITGTIAAVVVEANPRFAVGYYCPVSPNHLYEKPEMCPVDKFPMKHVRVEKTLALPAAAVVDSGTRKVVYRESASGVFDMVEVHLGARAGEFFPVLSGLHDGDQVAAAGAFLVDAENRLNPAAAVQFFGATGGPQNSNSQGGTHP